MTKTIGIALLTMTSLMAEAPAPPVASKNEHHEVRHGATVVDNYFWLREKTSPDVTKYLEAENSYTEAMTKDLKPFADSLYQEMLSHIKQTDLSVPVHDRGYWYYSRTEEGKQYPIQCRRKGTIDAPEQVYLDLNEISKDHKFVGLGHVVLSDDQNLVAYTLDFTGFRQYSLQVKDLRTGTTFPDTTERVTSLEWASDNKTLFLTTEDAVTKRSNKVFRHVLGSPEFKQLYEETDELYNIDVDRTRDHKYLVIESGSTDTTECRVLRADQPDGAFRVLLPREKKHRYYVDHREGLFYLRTNKDAKNFRVVTAPENDPSPMNWKPFIAHQSDVLIENIELFHGFAVAVEKSQALNRLRIHNFASGAWETIQFPEPVYSVFPGGTPDYDSTTFRYSYQSFVTPQSVFDYDTATGRSALLK
ncbi:MAG: oligopeptidase B, partial [Bryobacteraceae bacterium]